MTQAAAVRSPGQRIGRYALVRPLGAGGMGEVWEAELLGPRGFKRSVALKLIRSDLDGEVLAPRLVAEARIGSRLHHPNLVAAIELGRALDDALGEEVWFVATELVQGGSLSGLLQRGPLSGRAVVDLGMQLCAGLEVLHTAADPDGRPIVHRDLKPQNVLVDVFGIARIADFGIARAEADGEVAGTAAYMAPEQALGRSEPRSDLFAFGVVLFACATGRRPWGARSDARRAIDRVEEILADPAFLAPVEAAVAGLGEIVRRCLRSDPTDRWATAAELRRALAALRPDTRGPSLADRVRDDASEQTPGPTPPSPASHAPTVILESGNLPNPADRFFGRADELAALVEQIPHRRLVTLLGLGGSGKTRLAVEAARRSRSEFPGGAWFLDLAEARATDGILFVAASTLGIELERDAPIDQLGRALASRGRTLVVLDNLEQVVADAAPVVARWLAVAPEAHLLCTSRLPLGVAAERQVPIPALRIEDGVALFLDRASAPIPLEHHGVVADIVRALDGMPLAIELAAARSRLLAPPVLLARLADRLAVLSGGGPGRPARHRSLRASLEGTLELLSPAARWAFARLSVFEGRFDLDAAEAVLEGRGLDLLGELADASLLAVDVELGRFGLPVVTSELARDGLTPEERLAAEVQHGRHYARLAETSLRFLSTPAHRRVAEKLQLELDQLIAAARRAVARRDVEVAASAALAASWVLRRRGSPVPAEALLREVVEATNVRGRDRARLLRAQARSLRDFGAIDRTLEVAEASLAAAVEAGDPQQEQLCRREVAECLHVRGRDADAVRECEAAVVLARASGDRAALADTLETLARLLMSLGRTHDARRCLDEAIGSDRAGGAPVTEALVVNGLGAIHLRSGRVDEARAWFERALALTRELGDLRLEILALGNLGVADLHQGRHREALVRYRAILRAERAAGLWRSVARTLMNMSRGFAAIGEHGEADAASAEALSVSRACGEVHLERSALGTRAKVLSQAGRFDDARALVDGALASERATGDPVGVSMMLLALSHVALMRPDLPAARAALEEALATLDCRHAGHRTLLLQLVHVETLAGAKDRARELLEQARRELRETGDTPEDLAEIERLHTRLEGPAASPG